MTLPVFSHLKFRNAHIHLTLWGEASRPIVFCWHGMTRSGRDFDPLAHALSAHFHVVCPDMPGRGQSAWAPEFYSPRGHLRVARAIVKRVLPKNQKIRWIGTSLGGLMGIVLAGGLRWRRRFSHLVLNDTGPEIPADALERIRHYTSAPPEYEEFDSLERDIAKFWGGKPEPTSLRHVSYYSTTRHPDTGHWMLAYDKRLVAALIRRRTQGRNVWRQYDAIKSRALVLRGEHSDVLPLWLAEKMRQRGPKPQIVACANSGHAPGLDRPETIAVIQNFLQT